MRALQWNLKFQWAQHWGNLTDLVQISKGIANELRRWLKKRDWVTGRPLSLPHPDFTGVTDASLLGWGGQLGEVELRGLWSQTEAKLHINLLVLCVIRLALKAFLPSLKGRLVQVFTDNATAIWYCKKQGGVGLWTLCQEALHLWTYLEQLGNSLVVQHLVGSLSSRADKLNRQCLADHEWRLHLEVVQGLFQQWGVPWLDLLDSEENVLFQQFCALEFPRQLLLGDAFRREWSTGLLPRVLKKIRSEQVQVILLASDWARTVW